jgi:hypothetical protein
MYIKPEYPERTPRPPKTDELHILPELVLVISKMILDIWAVQLV